MRNPAHRAYCSCDDCEGEFIVEHEETDLLFDLRFCVFCGQQLHEDDIEEIDEIIN